MDLNVDALEPAVVDPIQLELVLHTHKNDACNEKVVTVWCHRYYVSGDGSGVEIHRVMSGRMNFVGNYTAVVSVREI